MTLLVFPLLLLGLLQLPDFIKGSPLSLSLEAAGDYDDSTSNSIVVAALDKAQDEKLNARPIVAVLSQELPRSLEDLYSPDNYTSYIGAAYVKYIESAGARVVPVLIGQEDYYYEMIFNSTNGLLIPGGAVSLTDSGYAKAARKLYKMALKAWDEHKDPYPIWGTCLGFELLALIAADEQANLASCWSQDQALPLNLTQEWKESHIGQSMPRDIEAIVTTQEVTANFHKFCLTPTNFSHFHMENFWKMLATGVDLDGLEFVAMIEAKNYPIWGTQYHPEKNPYEWTTKYKNIPHSRDAIKVANFHAEYFVEQTRRNHHQFESRELEEAYLIYNYFPDYTGREDIDFSMQQSYLF